MVRNGALDEKYIRKACKYGEVSEKMKLGIVVGDLDFVFLHKCYICR